MVFCLLVFASPGPFTEFGSADGKPLSATSAPAAGCVIHTLVYYITFSPCAQLFCPVSAEKLTCFRRIPFSSPMLFYRLIVFNGRGKLRSPLSAHRNAPSGHSGVSHGLFMISHHHPCGRWCFARLIRQAETLELQPHSRPPSEHTVLFLPKRSCFRFASLTLRLRTETFFQKVPVFRMAYSAPTAHRAVSSEALMLQPLRGLRTPHRPIVSLCFSPKRTTSSRFAASIEAHRAVSSKTLMLQPLRGLRTAHRSPVSSPLAAAAD